MAVWDALTNLLYLNLSYLNLYSHIALNTTGTLGRAAFEGTIIKCVPAVCFFKIDSKPIFLMRLD